MTELDIAREIASGVLPSPQKVGTFYLWDMRITGTGASYRSGLNEYVWRDPGLFLTQEFVARCNGLPVVEEHPEKVAKLNSEEFNNRVIGAVMLPYIKGDEVRGVARIYDAEAIEALKSEQLSTSPGVVFVPADGNKSYDLPNGEVLLIEGVPSLLDHLATCRVGVWDKGGPATGVRTTALDNKEPVMPEKTEAEKLDAILDSITSAHKRMDAMEEERKAEREERERADKARKDAAEAEKESEKKRADKARRDAARKDAFGARKDGEADEDFKKRFDADEKAACESYMDEGCSESEAMDRARKDRKDAETAEEKRALEAANKVKSEEEKDKARQDAAALSTENADLKARLAQVEAFMNNHAREIPMAERNALAAAQHRADSVAAMFGERAPAPIPGETSLAYNRRMLQRFQKHSPRFKDSRLDSADASVIEAVAEVIYNDAADAARAPAQAAPGVLIPMVETDPAGRRITRFVGDPMAWMGAFMGQGQVGLFNRNPKGN